VITPDDLANRAVDLTPRQAQVLEQVAAYISVAGEPPSYGWVSRRTGISRASAFRLMERIRERATSPTRRQY
jgi:hypothetical protein